MKDKNNISFEKKVQTFFLSEKMKNTQLFYITEKVSQSFFMPETDFFSK